MTQTAAGVSPRQARLVPGILSTLLTKVGQWFWTKLVSPLRNALQSLQQWFRNVLRPARGLDSPAAPARAPIAQGPADSPRSEVVPEVSPRLASSADAMLGTSRVPSAASAIETPILSANDRDLATGWHGIGSELSAGLGSLQTITDLNATAASHLKGLQILLRQVEAAAPHVRTLATDSTRGQRPVAVVRTVLLQTLLPVADTLHRGRQALASETNQSPVLSTLRTLYTQISQQLQRLLATLDVREIAPLGQRFDPTAHEAIAQAEDERAQPGHVNVVYLPGFWLGRQLLRPAQVSVAR